MLLRAPIPASNNMVLMRAPCRMLAVCVFVQSVCVQRAAGVRGGVVPGLAC